MAAPVVSIAFNKTTFAPGEQIVLTVTHTDADRVALVVETKVTDSNGNVGTVSGTVQIDQGTATVTSVPAKSWVLQSQTAGQAVFTTTA